MELATARNVYLCFLPPFSILLDGVSLIVPTTTGLLQLELSEIAVTSLQLIPLVLQLEPGVLQTCSDFEILCNFLVSILGQVSCTCWTKSSVKIVVLSSLQSTDTLARCDVGVDAGLADDESELPATRTRPW